MAKRTAVADRVTELILETFRLNGRLLAAGDRLTGDLGLTSARWQVMGAVEMAAEPLSVAQIARSMGLTRQAVQRVANDLAAEGLVAYAENPQHRRAKLVRMTGQGEAVLKAVQRRQADWANRLSDGLAAKSIDQALATLAALRERLDADKD